ncbi:MAG: methylated-DNA--[protein]-cysteine S-methyltransferase [Methanomicrobiales archaeon]|nr:methylated-DNA--[protein]-cysteine S-methyltransferase [Methanomicrobiales archaeon]
MALMHGACRFGLWWVEVAWTGTTVHRIRFSRSATEAPVPEAIRRYLRGQGTDLSGLATPATDEGAPYAAIYRAVRGVPYGSTRTYAEIARAAGTHPRVVGTAMRRNPVPLVIPCHRIVASDGIGGFSPDIAIKEALLALERKKRIF